VSFDRSFRSMREHPIFKHSLSALDDRARALIFNITSGAAKHPRALSPAPRRKPWDDDVSHATYARPRRHSIAVRVRSRLSYTSHNIAIVGAEPGIHQQERTRSPLALPTSNGGQPKPWSIGTIITFIAAVRWPTPQSSMLGSSPRLTDCKVQPRPELPSGGGSGPPQPAWTRCSPAK